MKVAKGAAISADECFLRLGYLDTYLFVASKIQICRNCLHHANRPITLKSKPSNCLHLTNGQTIPFYIGRQFLFIQPYDSVFNQLTM